MNKIDYISLFVLLTTAWFLLSIGISKPFVGHHDWNGVQYGNIARNHLHYGLRQTKFASVLFYGYPKLESYNFSNHHYPPLFPLFLAFGMYLFSPTEMTLRLLIVSASLFTLATLYLLGHKLYGRETAFFATVFALFTPLFLYFGKLPVHETVILPFIIFSVYMYVRWFQTPSYHRILPLVFILIIAELITWPVYILPFLLAGHAYLYRSQIGFQKVKMILVPLCTPFFAFGFHLIHTKLLTNSLFGGGLMSIFLSRLFTNDLSRKLYDLSFLNVLFTEWTYVRIYYTNILVGLVILWVAIKAGRFFQSRRIEFNVSILFLLFIQGAWYILVFREVGFYHDFFIYYLLPFVVFAAASSLRHILKMVNFKLIRTIFFIVIVVLIANERKDFVVALQKSDHSRKGYEIGLFINNLTKPGERTLVGSNSYKEFYDPFIGYYSERHVGYGENITTDYISSFNWVVRPKAHDALSDEIKIYLDSSFPKKENDNFIWYDLTP